MGMWQTCSSDFRPSVGAPALLRKVRIAKPQRIDARASKQLNSRRILAPRGMSEDWAVVQQAIAGNAVAQEHLFAPHTGRLYRTAFAVLRNKEDAEDALQDGLCTAYARLSSFQGRSAFFTWLARIVINSALMTRRRKRAHAEVSLDEVLENQPEQSPLGVVDSRPDPEELYAVTEIHTLVEQHVRQLPPALQTAYRLHAMSGLSVTESSHVLGIPTSVFKARVFRARRKLAGGLQQTSEIDTSALGSGRSGHRTCNG
jgi:RNA polymerase sigma-70 factor, ECF subfamily